MNKFIKVELADRRIEIFVNPMNIVYLEIKGDYIEFNMVNNEIFIVKSTDELLNLMN